MKGIKIEGYSNYWIFPDLGMVWSIPRQRTRGGWIGSGDGYKRLDLSSDDGTVRKVWLHRLIWESVNGEIPEGMVINHKDENPSNCAIWNLEVCTRAENNNYGTRTARVAASMTNGKLSKQVGAYKNGVLVMTFPSTAEAQRQGFNQGAVSSCCRNCYLKEGNNFFKGFQWKYLS